MQKFAQYIKRIEIQNLWAGRKHIVWELNPEVNILSGVNGVGKSTILNRIVSGIRHKNNIGRVDDIPGVALEFYPKEANAIRFDVIRTFDNGLVPASILSKINEEGIRSEMDWRIYELQRKYLDYQVNIGNRIISALTSGLPDAQMKAVEISTPKFQFQNLIDELFADTEKYIDRNSNEMRFMQYDQKLSPYALSSGEKQMIIILLTVLLQNRMPHVLVLDEPEVSLHVEWQEKLINIIKILNPNVQIILTTHSPALVMNGWTDTVTEVTDITTD